VAPGRVGLLFVVSVSLVSVFSRADALAAPPVRAADEAAAYEQKATSAFALGHFAEAAESFEKAFAIRSDPALLYNAAQAHRLGGNKERALLLYENYLRVYGKKEERGEEVQRHIDELRRAIAADKAAAAPAVAPLSATSGSAAPAAERPLPAATPEPATAPVLVTQPATRPASSGDDSLVKKPWFWGVVGGGVVAAAVVVLLLSRGGGTTVDPSPSLGTARGN
jgi:hypothetical protein